MSVVPVRATRALPPAAAVALTAVALELAVAAAVACASLLRRIGAAR